MSWLEYENINVSATDASVGGIRQIGRLMMMGKAREFESKIAWEIHEAKSGLDNPRVNVHIFSGLSGGTGSGCFLDVCYMIRSIAEQIGGVTIFGYFFLPDVNLAIIPVESVEIRKYIQENGYAAMQELDYCMRLPKNGGSFEQAYPHKNIKWEAPPVDMCHLISATDDKNNVIPDAYRYAMNVTAEYVMHFLTGSDGQFELSRFCSVFDARITEADARMRIIEANTRKKIGAEMVYCVIGGSSAYIPFREINTYLVSELFHSFATIIENIPSKADVEKLAVSALAKDAQTMDGIYECLYREICEGADGNYDFYMYDWKYVRDYGNSGLVSHYTNQTAAQINRITANATSMVFGKNQQSLLGRMCAQLTDVLKDIQRGPIFAYRMLCASENHNFLNLIDGLIAENTFRWEQEAAQIDLRKKDYENAKSDLENRRRRSILDNDTKRFQNYEYNLIVLEQHKLWMDVYGKMDVVLRKFKDQIREIADAYYGKLSHVMVTLIDTFEENRNALAGQETSDGSGEFAIPMVTVAEIKNLLDAEIAQINIQYMLDAFMDLLLKNEEDWYEEEENKISHLVINFFEETAFRGFDGRTITSFLQNKYENKLGGKVTNAQLTQCVYNDWMQVLSHKASPLFPFNKAIWFDTQTSKRALLSYPSVSAPIQAAAEKMNHTNDVWMLKESALTDRISFICCVCGLPLGSYANCTEYERIYFSSMRPGRHIYGGKPVKGMEFSDWNKLPSVIPQSIIDTANIPEKLAGIIEEARGLYDKAYAFGIIDDESCFYEVSDEDIAAITGLCNVCEKLLGSADKQQSIPALQEAVSKLKQAADHITMVKTRYFLPTDGYRGDMERILSIQKDYFVSSPAFHDMVRKQVEIIEEIKNKADQMIHVAKEKVQ